MNSDGLAYLAENTDITYLSEGGIARSLMEATNQEIARLQEYIASTYKNVFPNTAESFYLDLIGQGIGLPRAGATKASTTQEDKNIKFSVVTGRLGDYFQNPSNANQGLISKGTTISTADESIVYEVSANVAFPANAQEVYVPAIAQDTGANYSVGRNKLVIHGGPSGVNVTNEKEISNGEGPESDRSYRFRIANHLAASPTANQAAVRLAAIGNPDVARVDLIEFARGAGTFDALLVPVGNQVSAVTKSTVSAALDQVSAFGISSRAIEPSYIKFKISIQLIPVAGSEAGTVDASKIAARSAVLNYFESIPLGGEMIVNALRAEVINAVNEQIKDIKILDFCINGRPHVIRNYKLKRDELFTPDVNREEQAIQIV